MNARQLSEAINEIDGKYYDEAANYRCKRHGWGVWCGLAACLGVLAFALLSLLADGLNHRGVRSLKHPSAIFLEDPGKNAPSEASETPIRMDRVAFNEMGLYVDAARVWRDPELYDFIQWDKGAIIAYYGRDLTPAYLPEGLLAAAGNETASVIADKKGKIVDDTVQLGFYHAYYDDGSPRLTEGVAAKKGFSITASKIGILCDCIYILPENERKTTNFNGTEVTFGYRSMPCGPYDPENHEPSGHYDMYTAEFTLDGAEYLLIAEQMKAEEVVKVVASLIYGREVQVD